MDNNIPEINDLIKQFAKLPGLGKRSAQRIALHLLKHKDKSLHPLLSSMQDAIKK